MKGVLSNIPRRSDRRNAMNSWHRQGENNTLWHIANKLCSANQAACPCRLPSTFNTQRNEGVVYCEFTGNPYENLLLEHLRMFENGRQFDSGLVDSVIGVHSIEQNHMQHSGLTLFLPSSLFLKIDEYSTLDQNTRVEFEDDFKELINQSCVSTSITQQDNRRVDLSKLDSAYNYLFIPILNEIRDSPTTPDTTSVIIVDKANQTLYLFSQKQGRAHNEEFEKLLK